MIITEQINVILDSLLKYPIFYGPMLDNRQWKIFSDPNLLHKWPTKVYTTYHPAKIIVSTFETLDKKRHTIHCFNITFEVIV